MPQAPRELTEIYRRQFHDALARWKSFEGGHEGAYHRGYPGGFSAADCYAVLQFPGATRRLGNLAAVSISTHRDAFPVTSMPYVSPRGITQGARTTAGTLIFHTIDRGAFTHRYEPFHHGRHWVHQHGDELPLFDILLVYTNEMGMNAYEAITGVRILDMGRTISLENLHPAETYSFMALDYQPLDSINHGDHRDPRLYPDFINREKKPLMKENGAAYQLFDPITGKPLLQKR